MNEAWSVAFGIVAVSTIAGNLLFAVVFFKSDRLRRMHTSLLLINLAVADLIVGALAIPMYMTFLWPGTELAANTAFIQSYDMIDVFSGFESPLGLAAIALERVHSVYWPHKHRSLSKTRYYVALLGTWSLAFLQVTLRFLQRNNVITREHFFYSAFSCMLAIVIVIIVSYVAVWIKMKANRNGGLHEMRIERENKLAKTLAILTGIFLITWIPFYAFNMALFLCPRLCSGKYPLHAVHGVKLLHYSNSLVNPVIYSFRFPEVRLTLARIFCRHGQTVKPTVIPCSYNAERNSVIITLSSRFYNLGFKRKTEAVTPLPSLTVIQKPS